MTATSKSCPTCGADLDLHGAGECGSCLFQLAADVGVADRVHGGAFTTPKEDQLAPLMPDLEFLEVLGQGGMGVVYRVQQRRLNRPAALKVLPPERASDPEFVERFFREAQALAQLDHPNIVSVYDMGQRGPYLYILMEYIEGTTLRDRIKAGELNPTTAIRIVMDLCDAVEFAHEHGIVHRDIKPENVLIASNDRIKLVDFGLVKLACHSDINRFTLTEINLRMGTPAYMAPEQSAGALDIDHRVDIYALGVLLYESLTGESPALDYTPPSRRVNVDPRIDRAIHHAIRESPTERFGSASEMRRELEHIVRTPRRRLFMAGTAIAVLLLSFVVAFFWYQAATADPAPPPGTPIDGIPIAVVPFDAEEAREHQQRWADHLGVPVEWTNSIGMEFVLIPPGEYTRGIPEDQLPEDVRFPEQHDTEATRLAVVRSCTPAHRVRLTRAFYLGKTEVTQGQYRQIMDEEVGFFRPGMPGENRIQHLDSDDLPAENLGYHMVTDFCRRLSQTENLTDRDLQYRPPTDAEWGFAIRAGTDTTFWYGDELDTEGVYEVSSDLELGHPLPVGSKRPNALGLYDMGGNVSEYCSDWWTPDEFRRFENRCAVDPTGPEDGIPGGMQRVVRGGNFGVRPYDHKSTERRRQEPTLWVNTIGFRVAIPAEVVARKLNAVDRAPAGESP